MDSIKRDEDQDFKYDHQVHLSENRDMNGPHELSAPQELLQEINTGSIPAQQIDVENTQVIRE